MDTDDEDPQWEACWLSEWWLAREREADEDIAAGRVSRVYTGTEAMFAGLEAGR